MGKNGFMAIKLDISKAYDRVKWSFLREVMKRMGLNDKWVELVSGVCIYNDGVLSQATKNKTYTPKNICSSASKDRSHGEYLA